MNPFSRNPSPSPSLDLSRIETGSPSSTDSPLESESNSLPDDPRIMQAARGYLADLEAGRSPNRQEYLARDPELASAVAECLDGVELAFAAGQAMRGGSAADAKLSRWLASPPSRLGLGLGLPEPSAEPLGDFRIIREIGRGGMGIVYEAQQMSLGRRVALKVLPFVHTLDERQLQRFKTEAQAAAMLHHTNIVPVYAVGQERGLHYYAMQLIDGRPLDTVIRELRGQRASGSVDSASRTNRKGEIYRTAARIAAQVADALDYAHNAGILHRDVKPANLLLDTKGLLWVTDFGLAHVTDGAGLTRTGDVFGTLRYMSPEQAAGRKVLVDHRADIYSLGATLYELLTLEPVFPGNDRQRLLNQVLNDEPRPPRLIDKRIPVELETIVLKALAKAPQDRYAVASEMAADLRRFLDERPILARRPTLFDRARKWVRRHPAYVGAALVSLTLGVVGLAVSTALIAQEQSRTRQAYDRAQDRAREAEQRFQLARRSVDEMIRVAQEELADHPAQQTAYRRFLESALAYYQELIEQRREDPTAQADLEQTRNRVKTILADLAILRGARRHHWLTQPAAHDDLMLSEAQRGQALALSRLMSEGMAERFRDFSRLTPEERNQRFLMEIKAHEEMIESFLNPAQRDRLRQIALQTEGPAVFRDPAVVAELGLTTEQQDRIRVLETSESPFRFGDPNRGPGLGFGRNPGFNPGPPGFHGGPGAPPPRPPMDRILDLLTPAQTDRWRAMIGRPFRGAPPQGPNFGQNPGPFPPPFPPPR